MALPIKQRSSSKKYYHSLFYNFHLFYQKYSNIRLKICLFLKHILVLILQPFLEFICNLTGTYLSHIMRKKRIKSYQTRCPILTWEYNTRINVKRVKKLCMIGSCICTQFLTSPRKKNLKQKKDFVTKQKGIRLDILSGGYKADNRVWTKNELFFVSK